MRCLQRASAKAAVEGGVKAARGSDAPAKSAQVAGSKRSNTAASGAEKNDAVKATKLSSGNEGIH
jgi:hypothetical protein